MSRLLLSLFVVAVLASTAHAFCHSVGAALTLDPVTNEIKTLGCTSDDLEPKQPGEEWVDEKRCEKCICPIGCCPFGYAAAVEMVIVKDGEVCQRVRTGSCMEFKFVKASNSSEEC